MTSEEFASVYEQYGDAARKVILWKFKGDTELAEDALQSTAEYFLSRLDKIVRITESYFIQKVVNMAKDMRKSQVRQYMRVLPMGVGRDLELVEEEELESRLGRAYDPNSRADSY